MATNNATNHTPTQYNVITGGASGSINSVAPSATSGVPVISQGSSSQPIFGTAVVAGGGTGNTTATAYAVQCGGTTSTAPFQSIASVGTSGQVLTSNGAGALPTFQAASGGTGVTKVIRQVFTSTGTYTPSANMLYCDVEVVGGGGGGGGVTASINAGGGGGGGGGYSRKVFTAATIGSSQAVTIGAAGTAGANTGGTGGTGGTSSLGVLITATGGLGGVAGTSSATGFLGGVGGSGTLGDFNTTGTPGGSTAIALSGFGGSSFFGGGAINTSSASTTSTVGVTASSYGGGGSGASNSASATARIGGAGFAGVVIVTEYTS